MARWYPVLASPPSGPYSHSGNWQQYVRGPWDEKNREFYVLYPGHTPTTNMAGGHFYTPDATPGLTPFRLHFFNLISPPLKAQTLSGTFNFLMGVRVNLADPQLSWRVIVWVAQNVTAPRGTILDYTEPIGHPLPVNLAYGGTTGWGLSAPQSLTPMDIAEGDYLIVEVGVIARAALTTGHQAEVTFATLSDHIPTGTYYPDLVSGSTDTLTHTGWCDFSVSPVCIDPPANDSCAAPIVISTLPYASPAMINHELATYDPATDLVTTCKASFYDDEGLFRTIWWQYTAPTTGTLRVQTRVEGLAYPLAGLGGDRALTAYTGSCGALTQVGCAVGYNGYGALIKLPVTAGTPYRFRVGWRHESGGSHSSLAVRYVTRPSNDDFADRIVITALPFSHTADLTLATNEPGEQTSPTDWTSFPEQSVWYEWTADATPGNIRVNTMGSVFDSQITIWTGTWGSFTEVFSAPWTNTTYGDEYYDQANCVFRPTPGVTYYITVFSAGGDYWNDNGGSSLELTISRVPSQPSNETCATAFVLPSIPFYGSFDTTGAADGQMEIVPMGDCDWYTMEDNDSGKVLWFKWTADRTALMNLNTWGPPEAGPWPELILYTAAGGCGTLTPLMCGDSEMRAQMQFFLPMVAGTTYYLRMTSMGRVEGKQYLFLDEHYETFQSGDIVLSSAWLWLFAPNGALRLIESIGYPRIPTGSGIDPETGLLSVAEWYDQKIYRLNGRLEQVGTPYSVAPGMTPEVPGFFTDGRLYVGHWGNYNVLAGIDGLVDPSFAIRRFDPDTGALEAVHLAEQEYYGTAWLDPHADQKTLHYCSRGRRILGYDVEADVQLPDIVTLAGDFPTYRARGIRHRANGDFLIADAAEVKRVSATGIVLQTYPIDGRIDLNVLDQDPTGATMWVGDQDTAEFYQVDITTGVVLLKVPGGPYTGFIAHALCGISVVDGYRAGVDVPPLALPACPVNDTNWVETIPLRRRKR